MSRNIIILLVLFLGIKISAQQPIEKIIAPDPFLVKCFIKSDDKKVKQTTVRVICQGKLFKTVEVKKGKVELELPSNDEYLLEFISDGFFAKRIAINTHLDVGVEKVPLLELTMNLVKVDQPKMLKEDYDLLDFPVAYMAFNTEEGFYDINKKFSKILYKTIHESEKKYLREGKVLAVN